jgi:glycosyltransferase involved in cell wall biosynthesis
VARTKLSGELLRAAFFESADERREQHEIFVAETMRTLSQNSYKLWWNKYLDQQGLSSISAIDLTSKNVLSTIKFSRPSGITKGENEKISIIMSAYNSGSTAAYSIRSILEQTHENVEILICDDCSADNTLSEILRWKLPNRVRIFRSIANQGPYNIRNALIKEAEGEYITFQDADDFAHPERLERQLDRLKKSAAHSVIGRWVRLRPTGEVVFFRDHRCLRMSVVSIMARASLFRDQGPYRSVVCGADSEFLERLRVRFGKDALEEIDLPLIFGLWSEQSLTRSDGLEATEDGYRSKARRDYAEVAARQRLLGTSIIPDQEVERVNRVNGIFREFAGVVEL